MIVFSTQVFATLPNTSYNQIVYDENDISYSSAPASFVPETEHVFAGINGLKDPRDIYVDPSGEYMYIVDTGNNRIVRCDKDLRPLDILSNFSFSSTEDSLRGPQGVFVDKYTDLIYVCDTQNHRIIVFDQDFNCVRIFAEPEILLSSDTTSFNYLPSKVLVNRSGQMLTIVQSLNKGIMELSSDGEFVGYIGAPPVSVDLWQKFLRLFMTKEQRGKMEKFVPTEFDNFTFDESEFVYAASSTQMGQLMSQYSNQIVVKDLAPVKKLNPKGDNVIDYDYYPPMGDIYFDVMTQFVDVVYLSDDLFCALDKNMGRLYAYDGDGQFLYMFGGGAGERLAQGSQLGTFKTPIAVERIGSRYFVLDQATRSITSFLPTEYGSAIEKSASAYYNGDYDLAYSTWEEILRMNGNYHQAIEGMARVLLRNGHYKEALDYFKIIDSNGKHASDAFKQYRKQLVSQYQMPIFVLILSAFAFAVVRKIWIALKKLKAEAIL
jgi:DNA-binding beta-propeller fold protein YncE